MKKSLLIGAAILTLSLSSGVASAAESAVTPTVTVNDFSTQSISYTITLKVGETYQLPSGRNYKYYPSQYQDGGPYFTVYNNGLLTAVKYPWMLTPQENVGSVGIVDGNYNDIAEIFVKIIQ